MLRGQRVVSVVTKKTREIRLRSNDTKNEIKITRETRERNEENFPMTKGEFIEFSYYNE